MTEDPLYREIILEHWQHPQNYGVVEAADIDVSGNNPLCGDRIRITARLKNGKIDDIAFTGDGCAIAKASASLFTEAVKGKPLAKVKAMTSEESLRLLGIEVTPARAKCALLAPSTLQKIWVSRPRL